MMEEFILSFYGLKVEKLVSDLPSGSFHMCVKMSSSWSCQMYALKQLVFIKANSFLHSLVYFFCVYSFIPG